MIGRSATRMSHHQPPGRRHGRGGFRAYRISVQRASHVAGDQQQLSQPVRKKLTARDNNLTILRLCKKYEVPVILGSDAHISFDIARYDHIYELLQETRFPEELILNDKVEAFKKFIGR